VSNEKAADNADLKGFVDFYMTKANLTDSVTEAGYAPLHQDDVKASIELWTSAG
jgi:phage terminase small subunit